MCLHKKILYGVTDWVLYSMMMLIQSVLLCVAIQRGPDENLALAEMVLDRLNAHKADNPSMGEVRRPFIK